MNRGAARQPIFFSARDGRTFEALVGAGSERHGVEIHAHCLMTNHFHLLLHCPEGGLSEFMHDLSASYARHANAQKGTDGPLFRGRFRSLLIDSDHHLAAVGRYIHRNPKDLPGVVDLAGYRWSSLRYYAGRRPRPAWLTTSVLAAAHTAPDDYVEFVAGTTTPAASVGWAVETAIAEADDPRLEAPRVSRTVAAALIDMAPPRLQASIDDWLRFPTPRARAAAMARARQRASRDEQLTAIARRALELCDTSRNARNVPGTLRDAG